MSAPQPIQPGEMTYNNNSAQDAEAANQAQAADNTQLQSIANNGSALAQSQLQNATNNNIKGATGIIASAKGINPAMAAREAGYSAANAGQLAANQSAGLQAQTQMNALGQLSNNQLQQENLSLNQQNTQNALSAGIASNNTLQSQKFQGALLSGVGSALPITSGLTGAANAGNPSSESSGGGGGGMSGMMSGASAASAMVAEGGLVGGAPKVSLLSAPQAPSIDPITAPQAPHLEMAEYYKALSHSGKSEPHSEVGKLAKHKMSLQSSFAKGGEVKKKIPAMVSPGEVYLKPGQAKAVAKGKADPIKSGERIPGKPKVPGNSYANDIVPKKLDAGGVVIPNSVMQSSDPAHNAYKFVQAVMAKNRAKGKR